MADVEVTIQEAGGNAVIAVGPTLVALSLAEDGSAELYAGVLNTVALSESFEGLESITGLTKKIVRRIPS